ncbi:neurofilament heavy polypeptide-like protein [Labeo rohita]|uniref:Neurofilament heavy polypeptide-like protein n=1 Tax=Labeo rohita TaxID=84645 RepID=A0A498MVB2_LABRO|nr:neurofilament heavy polypeptide-like protein [Labeo rohita]
MIVSTMPTSFPESEQSSSPELSDELTTALATGRWWAIMEVSHPISEEPEYGDLTSGEWWGTKEAGVPSCPTSLVFSDESVKTESPYSGFPDAARKTKEQWRPKSQVAHVPPRSQQGAPVPAHTNMRDHTSSLGFTDASDKAESPHLGLSDASLKTTEKWRKWRQKKLQGTSSPAKVRDLTSSPVFRDASEKPEPPYSGVSDAKLKTMDQQGKWRQKKPQVPPVAKKIQQGTPVSGGSEKAEWRDSAFSDPKLKATKLWWQQRSELSQKKTQDESVLARSPQRSPLPNGTPQGPPEPPQQQRGKLKVPEYLRQHLLKAASELAAPLPARAPRRAPAPTVSQHETSMPSKPLKREPLPGPKVQVLKIPEPPRQKLQQQKPQASCLQGAPVPEKTPLRKRPKIPDRLRQELLQLSARASSCQGEPVPDKVSERQNLKLSETLRPGLQKPNASSFQGAPVLDKTPVRQRLKIPDPLRQELLELSARASTLQGAPVPKKTPVRHRLKIPDPLRQELLELSARASRVKEPPMSKRDPERKRLKIPEPLRQELLELSARASPPQGTTMPKKTPERQRLKIPERLRKELLREKSQASSGQGALMPAKSPPEVPLPDRKPNASKVPVGTPEGPAVATRTKKRGKRRLAEDPGQHSQNAVHSSTLGPPMPFRTSAPMHSGTPQGALPNLGITRQQRQKRRDEWRQQLRQRRQQKASVIYVKPYCK